MAVIDFPTGMAHMPYIDAMEPPLPVCCVKYDGLWKAVIRRDGTWEALTTGLPSSYTECSPFIYTDPLTTLVCGSVIAGNPDKGEDQDFALYTTENIHGGTWNRIIEARAGLKFKNVYIYSRYGNPIIFSKDDSVYTVTINPALFIYRISLDSRNPYQSVVTFQEDDDSNTLHTWLVAPEDRSLYEVVLDSGECPYKPCFHGSRLYYAHRLDGFEDREIRSTEDYRLEKLDFDSLVKVESALKKSVDEEFE